MNLEIEQLNQDLVGLGWDFHVSPISCDNPDYYEQYLRFVAVSDFQSGMGVTYLAVNHTDTGNAAAGYITLRASALSIPGEDGKPLTCPALEIAELAVAEKYERQGIGTMMLDFAVRMVVELRKTKMGVKCLLVVADPSATGFYRKYGFGDISETYSALYDGFNNHCTPMVIMLPEQRFC